MGKGGEEEGKGRGKEVEGVGGRVKESEDNSRGEAGEGTVGVTEGCFAGLGCTSLSKAGASFKSKSSFAFRLCWLQDGTRGCRALA